MQTRHLIVFLSIVFTWGHPDLHGQFTDDFSDGNFSTNPLWMGDTGRFTVNASNQLQLTHSGASGTSVSYLSTISKAVKNARWEFYFRCDFDPSTSNFTDVYLCSDEEVVKSNLNGYFVRIGGSTGNMDDISLYRQTGTIKTKIIDGADGTVAISPRGKIKVTRDSLGNWELFRDTSSSLGGYVSEGVIYDGAHINTTRFGLLLTYTSTRFDKFYFDDFVVTGSDYPDTLGPDLYNFKFLSGKMTRFYFTEKLLPSTGLDTQNYYIRSQVQPGPTYKPDSVKFAGSDSSAVDAFFGFPIDSGVFYNIMTPGIRDLAGNLVRSYVLGGFPFPLYTTANAGEVIINEIMADPSPPVALPEREFVEMTNASSKKIFDISNWIFKDLGANGIIKHGKKYLGPGSTVVLCAYSDTAAFGTAAYTIGVSPWPSLNNSGDDISLLDSSGTILDRVEYRDTWYKDDEKKNGGFSLERINPHHPCSNADNWTASKSLDGGTPNARNSVWNTQPDTGKPKIISVKIIDNWDVRITFSKQMDTASLRACDIWVEPRGKFNGKRTILPETPYELTLTYISGFDKGSNYSCRIEQAVDCLGNIVQSTPFDFGIGRIPRQYEVLITELFPVPNEEINEQITSEYIEITNTTDEWIDINNCLIGDAVTIAKIRETQMAPQSRWILCPSSGVAQLEGLGNAVSVSSFPSLNNTGDHMKFYTPDTHLIHDVNYTDAWYGDDIKKSGGWALEMIDVSNPCGEQSNWAASIAEKGGTPGKKNSVNGENKDTKAPQLIRAWTQKGDTIFLEFDEKVTESDTRLVNCKTEHRTGKFIKFSGSKIAVFEFIPALESRTKHEMAIQGFADCVGNILSEITVVLGVPETTEPGDVVINEVLFNPFSGATTDYVEIYNRSLRFIDLKNWSLASFDKKKDTIASIQQIVLTPYVLYPGEYTLMSKNGAEVAHYYPKHNRGVFLEMSSMPAYNNGDGNVILITPQGTVSDRFDYTEEMHFPLLKEIKGVSLERIDPNQPTRDGGNWHSAAHTSGFGTPGMPNSQAGEAEDFSDQIVLEPQTFSPDNDGFDDVMFINFSLPEPGYMCTIQIYDSRGKHILELANNHMLGKTGSFTWDGRDKHNEKAAIGLYIVIAELFDLKGKVQQIKKSCVLAIRF